MPIFKGVVENNQDPEKRFRVQVRLMGIHTGDKNKYFQTSYKLTPVLDPYASDIDKRETVDGWFVKSMPDLNQRNPHVMKYLIQNSEWWIEFAGIDGIRMDTYPYADRDGMALWMKTLDKEYPNFNTVGETWVDEPPYTAAWQKDSRLVKKNSYLKTVMDFSFYVKLNQAKDEETDGYGKGFNRVYNSLVYDYLYEMNIPIGKDISVAGFDNESISAFFRPQLTTTELPLRLIGKTSAELLLQKLEGSEDIQLPDKPEVIKIPCEMRIRDSVRKIK